MANIVTVSDFQSGSLFLPNATNLNTEIVGVPTDRNDLQESIDIYERELRINALGVSLNDILDEELLKQPFVPTAVDTADQKWIDLVNGVNYQVNGVDYRWDGLKGSNNQSLIAFFVYCQHLRQKDELVTTTGAKKIEAANAISVSATPKYINAFNKFINAYQGSLDGYYRNNSRRANVIYTYSGELGLDYYRTRNGNFVSLYQYLTDRNNEDSTNFPDIDQNFNFYRRENSLGL